MWTNDNVNNYPYLLLNPMRDANGNDIPAAPLSYTRVPQIPPALTGLIALCDQDMKEISGVSQANEEIMSNVSGKAVRAIQNKVDMKTYIYISNFAKAIKRTGDIWLSMARDVYVEEGREMKTLGRQNEIGSVELYAPDFDEKEGKMTTKNNIANAKMGVNVTVGPSSDSKRQTIVDNTTAMMTYVSDPETQMILSHMAIANMDGEGMGDIRKWSRARLLRAGAVEPTQEEKEMMEKQAQEQQKPDANEQFLLSEAAKNQATIQKLQADAINTMAKVEETQAKTEKTRAETIETLSEIETKGNEAQMRDVFQPQAQQNNQAQPERSF